MQLYLSLTSPYARKVRVLLAEKGIAYEPINVANGDRSAAEKNPLGKVPTLVLDDGSLLFDSVVITETLDALFPKPQLIPSEIHARSAVRRWEAVADGICDVLVPYVIETRQATERQDTAYAAKLLGKARASFEFVEAAITGGNYLQGDAFSLADIAVVSAAGYATLRVPSVLEGLPKLSNYVAFQLQRPSLSETVPPNVPFRG
jgi:glutathione S-transferase